MLYKTNFVHWTYDYNLLEIPIRIRHWNVFSDTNRTDFFFYTYVNKNTNMRPQQIFPALTDRQQCRQVTAEGSIDGSSKWWSTYIF